MIDDMKFWFAKMIVDALPGTIILILFVIAYYFFIWRPNRRRNP